MRRGSIELDGRDGRPRDSALSARWCTARPSPPTPILERKGARTALLTTRGFRDVLEMRRLRMPRALQPALREAGAAGAAPAAASRSTSGSTPHGQGARAARRGRRPSARRPSWSRGGRVGRGLLAALPTPTRRTSGASASCCAGAAGLVRLAVVRRPAGDPRVRADQHHGHQRLCRPGRAALPASLRRRARAAPAIDGAAADHAVERRDHVGARGGRASRRTSSRAGPAAGVIACGRAWRGGSGSPNVITFDMGGTTAKASMIEDGELGQTAEYEVGGGIIAGQPADQGRRLRAQAAGHRHRRRSAPAAAASSGSTAAARCRSGRTAPARCPGPACYGRGGTRADGHRRQRRARLPQPGRLAGGELPLDAEPARAGAARAGRRRRSASA